MRPIKFVEVDAAPGGRLADLVGRHDLEVYVVAAALGMRPDPFLVAGRSFRGRARVKLGCPRPFAYRWMVVAVGPDRVDDAAHRLERPRTADAVITEYGRPNLVAIPAPRRSFSGEVY